MRLQFIIILAISLLAVLYIRQNILHKQDLDRKPLCPVVCEEKYFKTDKKAVTEHVQVNSLQTINNKVNVEHLELVAKSKYPKFINHVWTNESSQGTNPKPGSLQAYCLQKGMTNEMGFYPQGLRCFQSFEESIERIERWYENEGNGLTHKQKLCYYNGAGKVDDCAYLNVNELAYAK